MKGDQAATVPREVGDHKRLVIFIADLQLSNPREATGVKFLNEAEAGHKSYVTIDFVPSSRSSAQKRSVVHHPADIIGIMSLGDLVTINQHIAEAIRKGRRNAL